MLLIHDMGMRPHILRPLDINQTTIIDGIEVTPICANHCPGAVCFLFRVPPSSPGRAATTILHTGDFRWCAEAHGRHPALLNGVDVLMLDTTYLNPKWIFPPQSEAVRLMVEAMQNEEKAHPETLFVCSSYHIGKERAYFGAATALGWKIWVPPTKQRVLSLLSLPQEWMDLLTDSEDAARIHVLGGGEQLHEQSLADRIAGTKWSRVVVLRPTGWTYRRTGALQRREDGCVTTIGIPYSEHSSYEELQDCVKTLRPKKLVPTVNAGDAAKSRALVDKLCGFMDLSTDRSRLDSYFLAANAKPGDEPVVADNKNSSDSGKDININVGSMSMTNNEQIIVLPGSKWSSKRVAENDVVDLDAVDVEEQRKLLEEAAERLKKKAKVVGNNNKAAVPTAPAGTPGTSSVRRTILAYLTKQPNK